MAIRPNANSITAQKAMSPEDDEPVVGKKPGSVTKPIVVTGPAAPAIVVLEVVLDPAVVVVVGLTVVVVEVVDEPATVVVVVVVEPATVVVVVVTGEGFTVKSKPVALEFVTVMSCCQYFIVWPPCVHAMPTLYWPFAGIDADESGAKLNEPGSGMMPSPKLTVWLEIAVPPDPEYSGFAYVSEALFGRPSPENVSVAASNEAGTMNVCHVIAGVELPSPGHEFVPAASVLPFDARVNDHVEVLFPEVGASDSPVVGAVPDGSACADMAVTTVTPSITADSAVPARKTSRHLRRVGERVWLMTRPREWVEGVT